MRATRIKQPQSWRARESHRAYGDIRALRESLKKLKIRTPKTRPENTISTGALLSQAYVSGSKLVQDTPQATRDLMARSWFSSCKYFYHKWNVTSIEKKKSNALGLQADTFKTPFSNDNVDVAFWELDQARRDYIVDGSGNTDDFAFQKCFFKHCAEMVDPSVILANPPSVAKYEFKRRAASLPSLKRSLLTTELQIITRNYLRLLKKKIYIFIYIYFFFNKRRVYWDKAINKGMHAAWCAPALSLAGWMTKEENHPK